MMPRIWLRGIQRPHPVLLVGFGLGSLGIAQQVLDPATTSTIAATIQQIEGYFPGSVAYQNNNPGNLVFAGQAGATLGAGGFAHFPTYQDGLDALNNQIQLYAGRGMTINDMMAVYAPASAGNNPGAYALQIASAVGVDPNTQLLTLGSPQPWDLATVAANLPADLGSMFGGMDPMMLGLVAAGALVFAVG